MADYLVLEEDGTSHLETEETADDLLLEESAEDQKVGMFDPQLSAKAWF